MSDERGQSFRERFNTHSEQAQRRAAKQGRSYADFLRECRWNNDVNCWHYDPLSKMTPEEREAL